MYFYISPDHEQDRQEFWVYLQNHPHTSARLLQQLHSKEIELGTSVDWTRSRPEAYRVPVTALPRKYAVKYTPAENELEIRFCGKIFYVS